MRSYLQEKIGDPDLFSGRKKEIDYYLAWAEGAKKRLSHSTAILSRRKTGKTALMQRLFNLIFEKNEGVLPFYYEVREGKVWALSFCLDFYLTFIWQYIAFKSRNADYLNLSGERYDFNLLLKTARQEGLDYLSDSIQGFEHLLSERRIEPLWTAARDAPRLLATQRNETIVQLIDEFQYLNSEIYWDEEKTNLADTFAAGYMITAEYRIAPLLISGSWIGWLRELLYTMLPSRFWQTELEDMPEEESVEMIHNYARFYEQPISEDVVYAMADMCEGNPFYISALFQSMYPGKDFSSKEGLVATLEFETLGRHGHIRAIWMEYIAKVFHKVNQTNAKRLVLYLSQHRDREVSRKELLTKIVPDMPEEELNDKLYALVKADILEEGRSNFYFRGVQDNIFDKIFRGRYADDIREFDPQEITNEYKALYEQAQKKLRESAGKYSQLKGLFAEFAIINQLRLHALQKSELLQSVTHNLPEDFRFVEYRHVWSYKFARPDRRDVWIDILARADDPDYSIIGEVKHREATRFSAAEAEEFHHKAQVLQEHEQIGKAVLFVFSRQGFTQDALDYFQTHVIAWSEDECWLG